MSRLRISVSWDTSTPGWIVGTCNNCDWNTGLLVSGARAQQALADHIEEEHDAAVDPSIITLPAGAPE